MIGLDTNVLIRYLTQDDPIQSAVASDVIDGLSQSQPGYISSIVLTEISWVLRTSYKLGRGDIANAIETLLHASELVLENREAALRALAIYLDGTKVDFSDCFIATIADLAGAGKTVTFDVNAAREGGMSLLTA